MALHVCFVFRCFHVMLITNITSVFPLSRMNRFVIIKSSVRFKCLQAIFANQLAVSRPLDHRFISVLGGICCLPGAFKSVRCYLGQLLEILVLLLKMLVLWLEPWGPRLWCRSGRCAWCLSFYATCHIGLRCFIISITPVFSINLKSKQEERGLIRNRCSWSNFIEKKEKIVHGPLFI